MMDDLISRQAALDALRKDVMGGLNYQRILSELPAAEPEWIPVTERLPKEGEKVLAWFRKENLCGENIHITYWSWHDTEDEFFELIGKRKVWYCERYYCEFDEIVAWMPLPQSWKGVDK